jgi:molybdopterin-guanine dinucleotide biosynthesis protein A
MTDEEMINEEMADKHAEEYCRQDDLGHFIRTTEEVKQAYIDGFLAGLEAGRPKWHKVADGDLPKVNQKVLLQIKDEDEPIMDFYRQDGVWNFANKYEAIAWCEIPKYTEE